MSDVLDEGPFFHGSKADLRVGDFLTAGFRSNSAPPGSAGTRQTPEALQAWHHRLAAILADERGEIIN